MQTFGLICDFVLRLLRLPYADPIWRKTIMRNKTRHSFKIHLLQKKNTIMLLKDPDWKDLIAYAQML